MRARLIRLLVGLPLLLGLPAAHAQMYLLPEATGNGSGSDWANARGAGGGGLQAAWDATGREGEVRLGSGDYRDVTLRIQEGGLGADRLRRLVGVDTGAGLPRILSNFDRHRPSDTGGTFVLAHTGASHFSVQGFRIEDHRTGISLRGGHQNVVLAGLNIQRARDGIVVRGGTTDTQPFRRTSGVRVEDTQIRHYTKRGVRIHDGVRGMEVVNTHVDGGGIDWATERFAMGFHVHSDVAGVYNENISFIDSSAQNHVDPNGNAYWNADGFVTDKQRLSWYPSGDTYREIAAMHRLRLAEEPAAPI